MGQSLNKSYYFSQLANGGPSGNSNLALSVFGCLWLSLTGDKNLKNNDK